MVEDQLLDLVFHALSDGTRRAMLFALADGPSSVGELAAPHAMSFAAAAKHVKVLEGAGLVRKRAQGRVQLCSLDAAPLAQASDFLTSYARFWHARLDALEAVLDDEARAEARPRHKRKGTRRTPHLASGVHPSSERTARKQRG